MSVNLMRYFVATQSYLVHDKTNQIVHSLPFACIRVSLFLSKPFIVSFARCRATCFCSIYFRVVYHNNSQKEMYKNAASKIILVHFYGSACYDGGTRMKYCVCARPCRGVRRGRWSNMSSILSVVLVFPPGNYSNLLGFLRLKTATESAF